jgi:prolyl oligopeptidase
VTAKAATAARPFPDSGLREAGDKRIVRAIIETSRSRMIDLGAQGVEGSRPAVGGRVRLGLGRLFTGRGRFLRVHAPRLAIGPVAGPERAGPSVDGDEGMRAILGDIMKSGLVSALLLGSASAAPAAGPPPDPYRWLEAVDGEAALAWVASHDTVSTTMIEAQPGFAKLRGQIREILDSKDRLAYVRKMGAHFYNFWRDADHPRGVWRRTSLDEYRKAAPQWETVLDLDALAKVEGENWVWKGEECRYPDWDRCLISLSRGGADAAVVREFDLASSRFVADGFGLAEAKSEVHWLDRDHLFVGSDFGAGSLTDSGYPRMVKLWQRGQPLSAARTIFEGQKTDVAVSGFVSERPHFKRQLIMRSITFYTSEYWLREDDKLVRIAVPEDAQLGFFGPQMLVQLRKNWSTDRATYAGGSLIAIDFERFRAGRRDFQVLFEPTERTALDSYIATRSHLVLSTLDNVKGRLVEWAFAEGRWTQRAVAAPDFGSLGVSAFDDDASDDYFMTHVDFLTPDSLYLARAGSDQRELLKRRPAFFDASAFEIAQYEATSRDATKVPYFIVQPKGMVLDGSHPTLLYGYGGFEVSLTPWYSAGVGKAWLERGGVYVMANIRGGGEFGPRWHEAALKDKRQNAYDDFIAVAEDLIQRKITRPNRLGIMGGSNGGLLMGVMLTQRPDLFGAVVCQVPLLDMYRYSHLLAGASWMGEYGDPDQPAEWDFIGRYSPYHNLKKGVAYPNVLFATSTRDDRVHPGHARKMMARMEELGVKNAWYYENTEGGHAGAADNSQLAFMNALEYTFLWKMLVPDK